MTELETNRKKKEAEEIKQKKRDAKRLSNEEISNELNKEAKRATNVFGASKSRDGKKEDREFWEKTLKKIQDFCLKYKE